MFRYVQIRKYRKDELVHTRNIRNLKRKTQIIFKKADKGNGLVAMTREQYITMGDRYLQKTAYGPIDEETIEQSKEDIQQLVETIKGRHPDVYVRHRILFETKSFRERYIYFLPKIHKTINDGMYPGRPITDTFGTFGITLDKIFTLYATRLRSTITTTTMGSLETIIKLEQFSKRRFNEKWIFLTFDIVDLYTNISITEALEIVHLEICRENILEKPIAHLFTTIMKKLFTNNKLSFGRHKVVQRNGIGM